jgi:hypothetical protein
LLDPKISLGFASAALLWFVGFGLIIDSLFVVSEDPAHLGIGLCCGGAVLMIRSMMCRATAQLENLFELGRDAGRAEARGTGVPLQRIH